MAKSRPKSPLAKGPKKKAESRVAQGDGSSPPKRAKKAVSVGVRTARRQDAGGPRARRMGAFSAAEASSLFGRPGKGGGAAFIRFLKVALNFVGNELLTAEEWQPHLQAFANRPIHGHRRTGAGGNHRMNKHHRR